MHPQEGKTYYQRLELYGWKKSKPSPRFDYYFKHRPNGEIWHVTVPASTRMDPFFWRRIKPKK